MNFIFNMLYGKNKINEKVNSEQTLNYGRNLINLDSAENDQHKSATTNSKLDADNDVETSNIEFGDTLPDNINSQGNEEPLHSSEILNIGDLLNNHSKSVISDDHNYANTKKMDDPINIEFTVPNCKQESNDYFKQIDNPETVKRDENNALYKCLRESTMVLNYNELVDCEDLQELHLDLNSATKGHEILKISNDNPIPMISGSVPNPFVVENNKENDAVLTEYDEYATKLLDEITNNDVNSYSDLEFSEARIQKQTCKEKDIQNDDAIDIISIGSSTSGNNSFCENLESHLHKFIIRKPTLVDVVSISSEEDLVPSPNDSECEGYHSSDFEFITESDAELDSLIINFRHKEKTEDKKGKAKANKEKSKNTPTVSTIEIAKVAPTPDRARNLPGPSNRSLYERFSRRPNPLDFHHDTSYRAVHRIPEGDDYLYLFQGIYNPRVISGWQNKAIDYSDTTSGAMLVEFDGVGFDMQVLSAQNNEIREAEEVKEEAKATLKKILEAYPEDNKRRRRF